MPIFNRFVDGLLFKGGILVTGIICLYLSKNDFLPRYMNPVSYGLASLGALGILIGLSAEENETNEDENDDPNYEERMSEFYRLKPYLEDHILNQALMMLNANRYDRRWPVMEGFERDSLRFEKILNDYESRLENAKEERIPDEDNRRRIRGHGKSSSLGQKDLAKLTRFYMTF